MQLESSLILQGVSVEKVASPALLLLSGGGAVVLASALEKIPENELFLGGHCFDGMQIPPMRI